MTITEVKQDLFTVPKDYTLVHCVSADFAMGAGIAKVRDEYENAVNEAIEKTENVWNKCAEKIAQSQPTIDKTNHEITKLLETVNQLNERLENVSFYKIERLLELVEKFNKMSDSDKAVLTKLVNMD